jgi:hypothetical protein
MTIKAIQHATDSSFLVPILKSGKITSPVARGEKPNSYYDSRFVYFTPADGVGIPIPRFEPRRSVVFHFKPDSLLAAYPKYFINGGNAAGPGDGSKGMRKTCSRCDFTYNTITPLSGECVKHSLEEIASVLKYSLDACDGGPELGIEGSVDILPHLMYITISAEDLKTYKADIPAEYVPYMKVPTGGKRRTRKMTRRYCKKTPCRKMGFSQKASCRPYKNCYLLRKTRRAVA